MNLQRKIEIAAQAVASVADHDDVDAQVRLAALDRIEEHIRAQRAAINSRVQASIVSELAG